MAIDPDVEILDCIDRGLDSIGRSIKHVIYAEFCRMNKVDRKGILNKPEEFFRSLELIFGGSARVVEAAVMREFTVRFGLSQSELRGGITTAISRARSSTPVSIRVES